MANCKDNCIHYKVCMYGDLTEYKTEQILKDDCDDFMPKDLVPKSEVERLQAEIKVLTENSITSKYPCCVSCGRGLILTKSLEEYDELLADIASEVAREIFQEIEKNSKFTIQFVEAIEFDSEEIRKAKLECYRDCMGYFQKLKKKYAERSENYSKS